MSLLVRMVVYQTYRFRGLTLLLYCVVAVKYGCSDTMPNRLLQSTSRHLLVL